MSTKQHETTQGARASIRTESPAPRPEPCTKSQGHSKRRGRPAIGAPDLCAQCGGPGARLPKRRYCADCEATIRAEATAWQERDGLHRYLHTRDDLPSVGHLAKLRMRARQMGMDWRTEPPAPMTYDARLAVLTRRPPAAKPKRTQRQAQTHAQEVA